jgi:subtilisin family serine protease
MRRTVALLAALVLVLATAAVSLAKSPNGTIGINVVLKTDITDAHLAQLGSHGRVRDVLYSIDAVTMQAKASALPDIQRLPFVAAANPDAIRNGAPIDTVAAEDFVNGFNTWDLDAVNVTNFGAGRTESFTGAGVYVAVIDTGLMDSWRQYFPEQRIAEEYAIAFGGGGGEMGSVSTQPNKWEHDTHGHGTHVSSTIIGYSLGGTPINGVAPDATIIPIKVLNQNGSGWSSVVARGIEYVAELKEGPLSSNPVVINMSLGGPELDAVEQAAIDRAIAAGVVVVASAGNDGADGMGFPGAYEPVISAAASGWVGEWTNPAGTAFANNWWNAKDVADPTDDEDFYIADFSSRELAGQDLDVAAPGSWVVGPFQLQQGRTSFFFLGGTSMASPHVAGIAALMAEKNGGLTGPTVESILEGSAIPFDFGGGTELCRNVFDVISFSLVDFCFGPDATGSGLATADAALAMTPAP